jgi:hypothetical protein
MCPEIGLDLNDAPGKPGPSRLPDEDFAEQLPRDLNGRLEIECARERSVSAGLHVQ